MNHNIIAFGKHWCQRRLLKHEGHKAQRGCYLPRTVKHHAEPGWDFYILACNTVLFPGNARWTRAPPKITGSIKITTKASLVSSSHSQPLWEDSQSFRSHTLIHNSPRWTQNMPKHLPCPTRHQLWLYLSSDLKGPRCQSEQHRRICLVSSSIRWDAWRILCKVTANRHLLPVFIESIS